MKTRNSNLQKTGLETLTAIAIVFVSCFTTNAQGAGFKNILSDNTNLALIDTYENKTSLTGIGTGATEFAYFAEYLTEDREEELAVENWMMESNNFGGAVFQTDVEDVLQTVDWMTDSDLFVTAKTKVNENNTPIIQKVNKPKTIGVTFPDAQFGRRAFILVEMENPKLELENWMVDPRIWKRKSKM